MAIKNIGRGFANIICKKYDIDRNKRMITRIEDTHKLYLMPLDMKLRDNLEILKKIRYFLMHLGSDNNSPVLQLICNNIYWGLRVQGQHTKTTGHKGKTIGVSKIH
ncbi:hypothetical protein MKX01_026390 [Papaver californicum]|nr:hypothetical protein MKX01_026390 [Papaver californicum]